MGTENSELTKEEKLAKEDPSIRSYSGQERIEKAKELLKQVKDLELNDEELAGIDGGQMGMEMNKL